jgi:RimJ/RimL family protein N-acetyltransferase
MPNTSVSALITTPRLILRAPKIGDGFIINESINKSIIHLKEWMVWAQEPQTLEESENYVSMCINNWVSLKKDLPLFIFLKKNNIHIGGTGFHSLNWDIPSFETGYWLHMEHQHQGYMTEALNALIRYAFIQFKANRLEILCDVNNLRSYTLAERLGFKLEGILQNHRINPLTKQLSDTRVYARTNLLDLPSLDVNWD